jgi:hypothetical protein
MESLKKLFDIEDNFPCFMQTKAWARKNLNTALGSWAELKHDVILYSKQAMAAECGGWGPPAPVCVGYVEPNLYFWKNCIDLLSLIRKGMEKYDLLSGNLEAKNNQISEMVKFLLKISEKEINKERISDKEYQSISHIGSSVENLTLSIMGPKLIEWYQVQGPDKSISVIADVYTYNDAVLEEGVGYANDIYVIVEISQKLYLTRGAVFSYYEFIQPSSNRLTDEQWQKILESGNGPDVPVWMKDLIVPVKPLETKRQYHYSSGC